MLLEISGEITPERMKQWSQSKNNINYIYLFMPRETGQGSAGASLVCRARYRQSHQQIEFSEGRGGTVEEVRLQPTPVLVTQPHGRT